MSRRVQTLLFTDIVGSTDRLRELGDAAWAALLVRYHGAVRAALAAHGGREVDTAGDGFLARFDAPASAVRVAVAAVAAVAPLGIEIRAGLHTGEVELDGDGMTGVGVHLAARVMAEAGPGQVLVSATVRELMAGSGLGFVDLGMRKLKGFAERWRLFALDPATVRGDGDDGANQVLWEPTAEVEAQGGTGVPVETGMVRRQDDRWVVARDGTMAVPEGVRDVAVWAGLVEETGADRYRFAHVLVRATLFEELSATRRRRLHRRVCEALEKLRPDDVAALAYHFTSRLQHASRRCAAWVRRSATKETRSSGRPFLRQAGLLKLPPTFPCWSGLRWPTRVDCRA